jgi:hypothetical protein
MGRKFIMRTVMLPTTAAAALFSLQAFTQQPSQGGASIPDFSGLWSHPYWPGFEPPLSGPGPVLNKSRGRQRFDADGRPLPATNAPLTSNPVQLVGDYTNPILKPWAADIVKQNGELELKGVGALTALNQCWPQGVPFIFWQAGLQMLQQPDKVTIL